MLPEISTTRILIDHWKEGQNEAETKEVMMTKKKKKKKKKKKMSKRILPMRFRLQDVVV